MALTGVNDKYLVTYRGSLCGQTLLSTFWYSLTAAGPIANVDNAYDALLAGMTIAGGLKDDFLGVCPNNYTLDEVWIQKVYDARVMKKVYALALAGSHGVDAPTANLAAVITRRGELANRRNVSTLHCPLPDASIVCTDGLITDAGYKTDLGDLAAEIKKDITPPAPWAGSTFKPVVFQPGPPPGPMTNYIVQTVISPQARVMRRRTVGLGI